jgi:hypothetical protein
LLVVRLGRRSTIVGTQPGAAQQQHRASRERHCGNTPQVGWLEHEEPSHVEFSIGCEG